MGAPTTQGDLTPPAFLRLAGHPVRWGLLSELAESDRTVHELTGRLGQPQSLVSYHLGRLRGARLVSARRSSADGRDAYYTVDLARVGEQLAATGGALHPALNLRPPSRGHVTPGVATARVLFLCTGNSARSQMAEAIARDRAGGQIEVHSAGSSPKAVHANAVRLMREAYAIDLAGHRAKHLSEFAGTRFDRVVTLCDRVREVCPDFPGHPQATHWSIPDPSAAGADDKASYRAFQQTAADLEARIGFLIASLTPPINQQEDP